MIGRFGQKTKFIKQGESLMKTIGLIGGMSWESSLEYYKIINETVKLRLGGLHSAQCIMYSVDFHEIEVLQHENKWDELNIIMIDAAKSLKAAGADFVIICTNTMHKMADIIEEKAEIKVFHIAKATGDNIISTGLKRVGLLGTKFTMEGDFYKKVLKDNNNIETIIPDVEDRETVHEIIYNELCLGILNQDSRNKMITIINKLKTAGAEGIILGCTEIPLLIKQEDVDVPVFDTTTIHAVSAVEFALIM